MGHKGDRDTGGHRRKIAGPNTAVAVVLNCNFEIPLGCKDCLGGNSFSAHLRIGMKVTPQHKQPRFGNQ